MFATAESAVLYVTVTEPVVGVSAPTAVIVTVSVSAFTAAASVQVRDTCPFASVTAVAGVASLAPAISN